MNECVTRPCKNGATCIDGVNQYTCQCVEGYTGPKCEVNIDECLPGFCTAPNSRCKDLVNGYVCECEDGFDGKSPQLDYLSFSEAMMNKVFTAYQLF